MTTTLILGAGASYPYGLPLGKQLSESFYSQLSGGGELHQVLQKCNIPYDHINSFGQDFEGSGFESIDTFLSKRSEYSQVGKLAIAYSIMIRESPKDLFKRSMSGDWYRYFWNQVAGSRTWDELLSLKGLNIITFNYDRSLESYILKRACHAFNKHGNDLAKVLEVFKIVHVYGTVGDLPHQSDAYKEYNHDFDIGALNRAVSQIKVIPDDRTDQVENFARASELLRQSTKVCFLGFGYDETNIQRLGIQQCAKDLKIYGTAFGLLRGEKIRAMKAIDKQVHFGDIDQDCLATLRRFPILQF